MNFCLLQTQLSDPSDDRKKDKLRNIDSESTEYDNFRKNNKNDKNDNFGLLNEMKKESFSGITDEDNIDDDGVEVKNKYKNDNKNGSKNDDKNDNKIKNKTNSGSKSDEKLNVNNKLNDNGKLKKDSNHTIEIDCDTMNEIVKQNNSNEENNNNNNNNNNNPENLNSGNNSVKNENYQNYGKNGNNGNGLETRTPEEIDEMLGNPAENPALSTGSTLGDVDTENNHHENNNENDHENENNNSNREVEEDDEINNKNKNESGENEVENEVDNSPIKNKDYIDHITNRQTQSVTPIAPQTFYHPLDENSNGKYCTCLSVLFFFDNFFTFILLRLFFQLFYVCQCLFYFIFDSVICCVRTEFNRFFFYFS